MARAATRRRHTGCGFVPNKGRWSFLPHVGVWRLTSPVNFHPGTCFSSARALLHPPMCYQPLLSVLLPGLAGSILALHEPTFPRLLARLSEMRCDPDNNGACGACQPRRNPEPPQSSKPAACPSCLPPGIAWPAPPARSHGRGLFLQLLSCCPPFPKSLRRSRFRYSEP